MVFLFKVLNIFIELKQKKFSSQVFNLTRTDLVEFFLEPFYEMGRDIGQEWRRLVDLSGVKNSAVFGE